MSHRNAPMGFRRIKFSHNLICNSRITHLRSYSSNDDSSLNTSQNPPTNTISVANQVLEHRSILIQGLSKLIKRIPIQACKFCPEVFVGEKGHLIQTCGGFNRTGKNRIHHWIPACLNDVFVPVHTYRLDHMFDDDVKHDQRFDFDPVDAVVELCRRAGADLSAVDHSYSGLGSDVDEVLSPEELMYAAKWTLKTWEMVRSGVKRLLLVYPAKKCRHCSEVHVGHEAGFRYGSWGGAHIWEKASVDDLVPLKIMWCRRRHDPLVLLNENRDFYGRAPVVVDLCSKTGIVVPKEYNKLMKLNGRSTPPTSKPVFNWGGTF